MAMATATALAIGSLAMATVGTVNSIMQANAAADRASKIASQNAQAAYAQLGKQQEEANRIATEQKADRIRKADHELGALRANDFVNDGGSRFGSLLNELGYVEGLDLGRIETNRKNTIDALQSKKQNAQLGAIEQGSAAAMMAQNQTTSSALGFVGSGLQIGAGYYARQESLDLQQKHYSNLENIMSNKVR